MQPLQRWSGATESNTKNREHRKLVRRLRVVGWWPWRLHKNVRLYKNVQFWAIRPKSVDSDVMIGSDEDLLGIGA